MEVNGHNEKQISKAITKASKSKKPTIISCKTIIGFGSPNKSGKASSHGSPLGCLLYTSPSPRDQRGSRMPSSA